ncbi:hypothetical protein KFE25_006891 [Diacronema lutheri]|uniref:Hexosyltransferase n=1 Tax=Diacronema lutheri TaxID=2081491 RepID=A0A8J5XWQ5_DIALT|nr:hypothetical protein KFE25_006891 [Diacronema lutheri]
MALRRHVELALAALLQWCAASSGSNASDPVSQNASLLAWNERAASLDDDWHAGGPLTFGEAAAYRRRLTSLRPNSREQEEWTRQRREIELQRAHVDAIREANRQQFSSYKMDPARLRIGICVIGQVERLELGSKVVHLLATNARKHHVDAVFALAPRGAAHFVNKQTDAGGRKRWTADRIRAKVGGALRGGKLIIDMKKQAALPYLRARYVMQNEKFRNNLAKKDDRARSHVRQWGSLWQCHQHFTYTQKANGAPYDVFIKLRDDSYIMRGWTLEKPSFWRGHVVVKQCLNFGGLNDKAAVVDAKHAAAFFAKPLLDWYFDFPGLANEVRFRNPESYLLGVMTHHHVPIRRVSADKMPTITSRTSADGAMCIPMDISKVGPRASCLPKDCAIRHTLFCKRCNGGLLPQTRFVLGSCKANVAMTSCKRLR